MHLGGPDVSVLIAAYRAEGTLPRAVRSTLNSTGLRVEVIVVDDASPDRTFAVAEGLATDPRVRAARLDRNGGPSVARNRALDLARGTWVAVLDADDEMEPDRLARMMAQGQGADVVMGNLMQVDGQGRAFGPFLPPADLTAVLTAERFIAGNMRSAGGRGLGYLKPLIRRDFLIRHGIAYDPTLRNGEDYHLILSCLLAGAVCRVDPAPGYLYTRAAGSISHRIALDHLAALIAAEDRLLPRLRDEPRLAAMVRARRQGLARMLTTETVLRAVKAGDVARALAALTARPAATAMILRQGVEGMRRRLDRIPRRP